MIQKKTGRPVEFSKWMATLPPSTPFTTPQMSAMAVLAPQRDATPPLAVELIQVAWQQQ